MEFCEKCGNILLPKRKTNELICKVCQISIPIKSNKEKDKFKQYKTNNQSLSKKSKIKKIIRTSIIVDNTKKKPSITQDEREAFGELFELSGE